MEVTLLRIYDRPEELIAFAFGMTRGKPSIPLKNVPKWINLRHESPIEHSAATFFISDISRSCLAQLVRHRIASYTVESMRYCDMSENEMVLPKSISDKAIAAQVTILHYEDCRSLYDELISLGVPKEDARFVLPLATGTSLLMTANFRSYRHIIKLRTHKSAQWEIRELANTILGILYVEAPNVFKDLVDA